MKKVVRVIGNICKAIVCLAYAVLLALCCYSWSAVPGEDGSAAVNKPLLGTPTVSFEAGTYPIDTEELAFVFQPGEVALLDSFTNLRSVDFSGSTCYEELTAWIQAHPEVETRYTVVLPDGSTVEGDAQSLSLPGMDSATAAQVAELLPYLPQVKALDLGSEAAGASLQPGDIALLQAACPEAALSYSFSLAGQQITLDDESLDLSSLSHGDVARAADLVSCMKALTHVDLGGQGVNDLVWEDVGSLQAANPQAEFAYSFSLFGKDLTTLDETLDFNHISMDDGGAAVRSILPYMQKCSVLDMDFCNVSNEDMAAIRNDFPNIKVIWRIWFGTGYSVRTDVEKILASKPSKGGVVNDEQLRVLQYCTDIKYLDLGHNETITDLSFVYSMPKLEVLVIAMNPLSDITPLASCPHLEYLELNSTDVADLSPLSGLTELRHLNIGNCPNVSDISPLYGLKDLERLWIGCIDPVPEEQVEQMKENAPNCRIDTETYDPTQGGWRYADLNDEGWAYYVKYGVFLYELHPRYELLREQFGYEQEAYSFSWLDPLYDPHD